MWPAAAAGSQYMERCTTETHKKYALTPALWYSLSWVGIQPGYNDDGDEDDGEKLELRNCSCGSTLCRKWLQPGE